MATYKGVYFCESDPERWFYTQKEADRFDKIREIVTWIAEEEQRESYTLEHAEIVSRIMERYEIKQRWDWKEPTEDVQK